MPATQLLPELKLPAPEEGILLTQFLIASDVARSREFYADVLGGEVVLEEDSERLTPAVVKLANAWIIINVGGGPTEDKPEVTLATPADPSLTSAFLNIRVADIQSVYEEWSGKGAEFLTPPIDNHGVELRCYIRDPDGHLIEVGQLTSIPESSG